MQDSLVGLAQPALVHYVPVVTTVLAVPFALPVYRRWRAHPDRLHLLWWAIGIATYGAGTFAEAWTELFGPLLTWTGYRISIHPVVAPARSSAAPAR